MNRKRILLISLFLTLLFVFFQKSGMAKGPIEEKTLSILKEDLERAGSKNPGDLGENKPKIPVVEEPIMEGDERIKVMVPKDGDRIEIRLANNKGLVEVEKSKEGIWKTPAGRPVVEKNGSLLIKVSGTKMVVGVIEVRVENLASGKKSEPRLVKVNEIIESPLPKNPVLDPAVEGDLYLRVTIPTDADLITISLPNSDEKVGAKKVADGSWKSLSGQVLNKEGDILLIPLGREGLALGDLVAVATNTESKKTSNRTLLAVIAKKADNNGILLTRISGADRIETSIKFSESYYSNVDTVIIARMDVYADALSAGILSKELNAPILLSKNNSLDLRLARRLSKIKPEKIIIIGGYSAISKELETKLAVEYCDVLERISGKDRYETSAAIGEELQKIKPNIKGAIIVSGETWPDALAATALGGKLDYCILLVKKDIIPVPIKRLIDDYSIKDFIVVGGGARISNKVKNKLNVLDVYAGKDRYDTAYLIAKKIFNSSKSLFLASGDSPVDCLIAGGVAAKEKSPILLTEKDKPSPDVNRFLNGNFVEEITILGGYTRVGRDLENSLK